MTYAKLDNLAHAADRGHAESQYALAVACANGDTVPQDAAQAVAWYREAAEQGHAVAQCSLGNAYASGHVVPLDFVEAYKWFNLAASRSSGDSKAAFEAERDALGPSMTSMQITEAQRRASAWCASFLANQGQS